jgi:hypothetical protein
MADAPASLNVRVAILESERDATIRARLHNDGVIEGLVKRDHETLLELRGISEKFDALLKQFAVGFKILSVCAVVAVTIVGAFWTYSHDMDMRYAQRTDKADQAINNNAKILQQQKAVISGLNKDVDAAQDKVEKQQDVVDSVAEDVQTIKKKRVFKASK